MDSLIVLDLPDEVHHALLARAERHGRSLEDEVRTILTLAVQPAGRYGMGDALWALGREIGLNGLNNTDFEVLDQVRDRRPAEPIGFGG